jgi:hypothetical protein
VRASKPLSVNALTLAATLATSAKLVQADPRAPFHLEAMLGGGIVAPRRLKLRALQREEHLSHSQTFYLFRDEEYVIISGKG